MTTLLDLRFAMRWLGRNPGFAAMAILTLAFGIAASSAMFAVVHAVLFRDLPYPDVSRIVAVTRITAAEPAGQPRGGRFHRARSGEPVVPGARRVSQRRHRPLRRRPARTGGERGSHLAVLRGLWRAGGGRPNVRFRRRGRRARAGGRAGRRALAAALRRRPCRGWTHDPRQPGAVHHRWRDARRLSASRATPRPGCSPPASCLRRR